MKDLKTERLNVQVTRKQKELIQDAAAAVGLTVSAYVLHSLYQAISSELGGTIKRQDSEL